MEHDHTDSATATTEIVELRGGKIWELTTESGEQMVIDRGFVSNGGSIRDRWKVEPDGHGTSGAPRPPSAAQESWWQRFDSRQSPPVWSGWWALSVERFHSH